MGREGGREGGKGGEGGREGIIVKPKQYGRHTL